ncbi:CoA transferase [Ottowia thiooxydans]|uniref:CoA transferase n=1 Tax=Ottowia thiooxydans TaxID=219182 RepID=UPI0003FD3C08|nr:CoA transferase [Ottowia thiooxydans]
MYNILNGIRVVECASFIAAPSCALHLQQMGAQVIRIDPVGGGPDARRWPRGPVGNSLYWDGLNKGKLSVAINFSSEEGRELITQLVCAPGEGAGLFVTNFPADGFLSHERMARYRADLITARVMGWADGSPAVDYTVNAAIGVPYMTGPVTQDGEPVNHVLPAWDLLTGAYAAFALLAAERHRQATGLGQEIRVPLSDMAIASLGHIGQIAEVLTQGDRPRMGNTLFGAFGRDFITADRQRLMVVAITSRQWSGLLAALGLADVVGRIESARGVSFAKDEGLRFEYRDVLTPLVEAAVASRDAADLSSAFDANGVCWGAYRTLAQALSEEPRLVAENPIFSQVADANGATYPLPGAAATLVQSTRGVPGRAPRQGEHTDQVLAETLGFSSAQIGKLHDSGCVAGPLA